MKQLIENATLINEGRTYTASVLISGERIERIIDEKTPYTPDEHMRIIPAQGRWLLPGVIDDQVHFREPGLTHKGNLYTESKAAVAGGVTSYMDMPNTVPQATSVQLLEEKYALAQSKSLANFSFYMGATNTNIAELLKVNPTNVCGVKVFMGSSTGNMLVNDVAALNQIFSEVPLLIAVHCEDEQTIQANIAHFRNLYGNDMGIEFHPRIRSEEACYQSSSMAVELARKHNTRLHILHISTARELALFDPKTPLSQKRITAEVCLHHLWFSDQDYARLGNRIKWNPAVKTEKDRAALIQAVNDNRVDVVATDHAPHTREEKTGNCLTAASGGPLVQFSLVGMLQLAKNGAFTVEKVVEKMCHAPAELFRVEERGYIRPGYFADLVLVNPNGGTRVSAENIYSQCGWSPFEGETFDARVEKTFVNGQLVFDNGKFDETARGRRLTFAERA